MSGPTNGHVVCGCGRIMRVKTNNVTVEELFENGRGYKLWYADLFECAECGTEAITNFGTVPFAEHYQPTYATERAQQSRIYPARCRPVAGTVDAGGHYAGQLE
jgi:F0F1-type ATP synthase beta subunit